MTPAEDAAITKVYKAFRQMYEDAEQTNAPTPDSGVLLSVGSDSVTVGDIRALKNIAVG